MPSPQVGGAAVDTRHLNRLPLTATVYRLRFALARFASIEAVAAGTRAVKVIEMPLANVPYGVQRGTPEQAIERERNPEAYPRLKVGVRALLPFEREKVLELAGARAKAKGGVAEEANPLYRHALAIYTVAAAYVDPDVVDGDAPLFFGDTVEEAAEKLRTSKHITDDIVLYLREQQEIWQDQINPQALTIADNELWSVAQKAAESEDFLHYFRPGMLARLAHLLANLLLNAPEDKSLSSAPATASTSGE